jgi:hypothetical protein
MVHQASLHALKDWRNKKKKHAFGFLNSHYLCLVCTWKISAFAEIYASLCMLSPISE